LKLLLIPLVFVFLGCGNSGTGRPDEILPPEPVDGDQNTGNTSSSLPPPSDPQFTTLPDGGNISDIKVSGGRLTLSKGTGKNFAAAEQAAYEKLKTASQTEAGHPVQWVFVNLDTHEVIEKSLSSDRRLFGASSSKIYVAATLLDKQNGALTPSQLQLMANMLVVSSNEAWLNLQKQIGDGSADKGRERNYAFTQRMGYPQTRGYQGTWNGMHGNELVPDEIAEMLYDLYTKGFPGAEMEWKLMHTCRTGANRGRKYIPKSVYVGGKTGTYDGPTENPYGGGTYTVHVRNHVMVFNVDGIQFGLAILANSGSDESAALIAGGLIREFTSL
jgi:hypothetical protein